MLTNVFYYNIYKPFIMQRRTAAPQASARSVLDRYAQNEQLVKQKAQVTKNNAIKQDVVEYVSAVCRNVTDMKDSAKYLSQNAEQYYYNVLSESLATAKQWLEEDVSMFVNAFNSAVQFGESQEHSPELGRYAAELRQIAVEHSSELAGAGITVHEQGGFMNFSANRIHNMDYIHFGQSISGAALAANAVYDRTSELLQLPAEKHMDFRQLSYYYNYRVDQSDDARRRSTANLYSGIVLDRVI